MSKEALYPSQINTKTISCRISSADYVNFLQDALSKGITLNDWLLMKIYNQNENKSQLIGKEESTGDALEFPFTIQDNDSEDYTFYNLSDIQDFIINSQNKVEELILLNHELRKNSKTLFNNLKTNIDLNNEKDRDIILAKFLDYINQIEWESFQDKKKIKRELNSLFSNLFE